MKVRQFLNKFLYASSTIDHVFVIVRGSEKTRLCGVVSGPMAKETRYEKQLNATLVSFRITGGDLTIYAE